MKKLIAGLTLALGTLAAGLVATPAQAHGQAHITCENAGACVVVYYNGYYMARRWNDTTDITWVRVTSVAGASNFHVAPVYCPSDGYTGAGTCTIFYSSAQKAWYGREFLGYNYRLTL